jgi:hypothetical protein
MELNIFVFNSKVSGYQLWFAADGKSVLAQRRKKKEMKPRQSHQGFLRNHTWETREPPSKKIE